MRNSTRDSNMNLLKGNCICPGLHPQQPGPQGQGGDSAHLLCSGETPGGTLYPALGFLAQKGFVGASPPEKGHGDNHRSGALLLRR